MSTETKKLREILEIVFLMSSSQSLNEVLDTIMNKAKEVMEAEASSLMLLDPEGDELAFQIVQGPKKEVLQGFRLKIGEGIAGRVASTGVSEVVNDVAKVPHHFKGVDEKSQYQTRNLLCAPLRIKRDIIGTVQVLNKKQGDFSQDDLYLFEILASQAAISIEKARLYEEATRDGLTHLYIRRFFDVLLRDEFLRARREKKPLTLAMFDIDYFKKVNDTHGHQAGDEVLRKVADLLQDAARDQDIVARYGGEEFALIMPNTDAKTAAVLLEEIRRQVEARESFLEATPLQRTLSTGFVTWPDVAAGGPADLVSCADKALYLSKENGRNRVTQFG